MRFHIIKKIVEHARVLEGRSGKKVRFAIQTNASIFTQEIVDFLALHNFDIGISADGDEVIHDKFRVLSNEKGTYRLFKRSLEKYEEFFTSRCGILTTVTSHNVQKLPEIIQHFQELGFKTWNTTLYDIVGRGAELAFLSVTAEEYCEALLKIVKKIEDGEFQNIAIKPILSLLDNVMLTCSQ